MCYAAYLQPKRYICIHLGAEIIDSWSRENFASIGSAIIRRGYDVVLTGTVSETEVTKIISLMQTQPINLTGKISIGAMAALLTNARLTVSNDIDMHYLATALNLPSIAIVSDEGKCWAPMNDQIIAS
ncbi:MAG: hypothetical protein IGS39_21795 [Calothrix sp. C42_A2020_038]|nr:hypothetical protein [Calothrix sp. C42_A2020_038]